MKCPPPEDLAAGALRIRLVEEALLEQYGLGNVRGTLHTCIGQEFTPVALGALAQASDQWFSNHRGHGHFLGRGGDLSHLLAEVLGRRSPDTWGMGGSQHLCSAGFVSNGIQGGLVPVSVGFAFHMKGEKGNPIAVAFVGDGTLGQGQFWEALNLAAAYAVPLLVVVEDNGIAQSTPTDNVFAGSLEARVKGFGVRYTRADSRELHDLTAAVTETVGFVRESRLPAVLHVHSQRLMAHSKGDDNRDPAIVRQMRDADPLGRMVASGFLSGELVAALRNEVRLAVECALTLPLSELAPVDFSVEALGGPSSSDHELQSDTDTQAETLHNALGRALSSRTPTLLVGQDIEFKPKGTVGRYGGAFKISRDLSERFPGQVLNAPISEATLAGFGIGYALAGGRAIVEFMFGDFLLQAIDQIHQQASKLPTMFGPRIPLPVVFRSPMGGGLGYGATHSQSTERLFLGLPNVVVVSPSIAWPDDGIFDQLLNLKTPCLVVENKLDYRRRPPALDQNRTVLRKSGAVAPTLVIAKTNVKAAVTIVTYGGATHDCLTAQEELARDSGLCVEVIIVQVLSPLDMQPILASVAETGRLITVEHGTRQSGFGAEVLAECLERSSRAFSARRLAGKGIIPANAAGETAQGVGIDEIKLAATSLCKDSIERKVTEE